MLVCIVHVNQHCPEAKRYIQNVVVDVELKWTRELINNSLDPCLELADFAQPCEQTFGIRRIATDVSFLDHDVAMYSTTYQPRKDTLIGNKGRT